MPAAPDTPEGFAAPAKFFHWLTAAFVLVLIPVGITMVNAGPGRLADNLYSLHKVLGFTVLFIIAARLTYRLVHGRPPQDPSLAPWQRIASRIVHAALYGLLVIVPILGWTGISAYPALTVFDLFDLPAITTPDQPFAERVLAVHAGLALTLAGLVCVHVAAALFHHFIRGDTTLMRMLPGGSGARQRQKIGVSDDAGRA